MKKLILTLIALSLLGLAGLYAVVLLNGPRMRVQQHIRAFQMVLPLVPPGTVTTNWPDPVASPTPVAGAVTLPADKAAVLQRGRVYYHYYCVFCHGEKGDGHGPVGESYLPVPADLRSAKVKGYDDRQLLRAMLTGIGHEPILERVVDPQHRMYLMLFVRSM